MNNMTIRTEAQIGTQTGAQLVVDLTETCCLPLRAFSDQGRTWFLYKDLIGFVGEREIPTDWVAKSYGLQQIFAPNGMPEDLWFDTVAVEDLFIRLSLGQRQAKNVRTFLRWFKTLQAPKSLTEMNLGSASEMAVQASQARFERSQSRRALSRLSKFQKARSARIWIETKMAAVDAAEKAACRAAAEARDKLEFEKKKEAVLQKRWLAKVNKRVLDNQISKRALADGKGLYVDPNVNQAIEISRAAALAKYDWPTKPVSAPEPVVIERKKALQRLYPESLSVFQFEGKSLHVAYVDGKAWIYAKDLCKVLGIKKCLEALETLPHVQKALVFPQGVGEGTGYFVVSVSGAYQIIAECFQEVPKAVSDRVSASIRNGFGTPIRTQIGGFVDRSLIPA